MRKQIKKYQSGGYVTSSHNSYLTPPSIDQRRQAKLFSPATTNSSVSKDPLSGIGINGINFSQANIQNGEFSNINNPSGKSGNSSNNNFLSSLGSGILGLGASMSGALGPKYQTTNKLGNTLSSFRTATEGIGNPLINQAGNAISGGIMKLGGVNSNKMISGADAGFDAVMNVASAVPIYGPIISIAGKALNSLFASNVDDIHKDERVQQSSGFTGASQSIANTADKYGGGAVGGIGTLFGEKTRANKRIFEANQLQDRVKSILSLSDLQKQAADNSVDQFALKNQLAQSGGDWMYNGSIAVAKEGGIIEYIDSIPVEDENKLEYNNSVSDFNVNKFDNGGKLNVIPEGALHARKHNIDMKGITKKGIPVISNEEGGEVAQHAEIEVNEIIFRKEATDKIEDLRKEYEKAETKKEKDEILLKLGEYVTYEIIENTDDRTGITNEISE